MHWKNSSIVDLQLKHQPKHKVYDVLKFWTIAILGIENGWRRRKLIKILGLRLEIYTETLKSQFTKEPYSLGN